MPEPAFGGIISLKEAPALKSIDKIIVATARMETTFKAQVSRMNTGPMALLKRGFAELGEQQLTKLMKQYPNLERQTKRMSIQVLKAVRDIRRGIDNLPAGVKIALGAAGVAMVGFGKVAVRVSKVAIVAMAGVTRAMVKLGSVGVRAMTAGIAGMASGVTALGGLSSSLISSVRAIPGAFKSAGDAITGFGIKMGVAGAILAAPTLSLIHMGQAADEASGEFKSLFAQTPELADKAAKRIRDSALRMTRTWTGVTVPTFTKGAYTILSAMSNLSIDGVAAMTEMATLTAKATKGTVDQMAQVFAQGAAAFQKAMGPIGEAEFAEQFSGIIASTVLGFKTDAGEMAQAIKNIGSVASEAGIPIESTMAALGTLQTVAPGAQAGTALRAIIQRAGKADVIFKKLGVTMQLRDAGGKIPKISELIRRLNVAISQVESKGLVASDVLAQAFGEQPVALLSTLIGNIDKVAEGEENIAKARAEGAKFTERMARLMDSTFGQRVQLMIQKIGASLLRISEALGDFLLPFVDQVNTWLDKLDGWLTKNKEIVQSMVKIIAGVGALGASMLALAPIFIAAGSAIATVGTIMAAVLSPGGLLIATFVGLGKEMLKLSSTKTKLIAAFNDIKATIADTFGGIAAAIETGDIQGAFQILVDSMKLIWAKGVNTMKGLWDEMKFSISEVFISLKNLLKEAFQTATLYIDVILTSFDTAMTKMRIRLLAEVAKVQAGLPTWLGGGGGKGAELEEIKKQIDAIASLEMTFEKVKGAARIAALKKSFEVGKAGLTAHENKRLAEAAQTDQKLYRMGRTKIEQDEKDAAEKRRAAFDTEQSLKKAGTDEEIKEAEKKLGLEIDIAKAKAVLKKQSDEYAAKKAADTTKIEATEGEKQREEQKTSAKNTTESIKRAGEALQRMGQQTQQIVNAKGGIGNVGLGVGALANVTQKIGNGIGALSTVTPTQPAGVAAGGAAGVIGADLNQANAIISSAVGVEGETTGVMGVLRENLTKLVTSNKNLKAEVVNIAGTVNTLARTGSI